MGARRRLVLGAELGAAPGAFACADEHEVVAARIGDGDDFVTLLQEEDQRLLTATELPVLVLQLQIGSNHRRVWRVAPGVDADPEVRHHRLLDFDPSGISAHFIAQLSYAPHVALLSERNV